MRKLIVWIMLLVMAFSATAMAETAFPDDPQAINQAAGSVLMLDVYGRWGIIATGSGFVLYDDGILITNYHVIEDGQRIVAHTDNGESFGVDRIYAVDRERDIAILGFAAPTGLEPLQVNDEELLRAQRVVAIGSPLGLLNTVSMGNISSMYNEDDTDYIQFTAPISSGSSGGALFSDSGKVIGITSAAYTQGEDEVVQNLNLAVAITQVETLYSRVDRNVYYEIDEFDEMPDCGAAPRQTEGEDVSPEATTAPEFVEPSSTDTPIDNSSVSSIQAREGLTEDTYTVSWREENSGTFQYYIAYCDENGGNYGYEVVKKSSAGNQMLIASVRSDAFATGAQFVFAVSVDLETAIASLEEQCGGSVGSSAQPAPEASGEAGGVEGGIGRFFPGIGD